jgi:hypothetical protein
LTTTGSAVSRSASANSTFGDFPPSSSVTGTWLSAAARLTSVPTSGDPVNARWSMPGWAASAAPASSPSPGTTFSTPGGRPASRASSPKRIAVSGASSAGFSTQQLPVASAGATVRAEICIG